MLGFQMVVREAILSMFTVSQRSFLVVSLLLILGEALLCGWVIDNVKYTEIDWSTYMQQVECFLSGVRNYSQIGGDTGPVVYPAGHIYAYGILYSITSGGKDIRRAQYIFEILYLMTLLLVFRVYYKSKKIPPFVLFFLCCISYRIHSIFLLRLFNDPIAMLFFYVALNFWISRQWIIGCIFYSLAVSIKMNVLLFAPAVFFMLLLYNGVMKTAILLIICGIIQVLLALPFLTFDPISYLSRSFDLGRVFLFKWTVNWRFLPPEVFLSRRFHLSLLGIHFSVLLLFAFFCWFRNVLDILYALFTANLIGIAVARSLHYQFYSWYFHSLPYLLFSTLSYKNLVSLNLCWNSYPSTKLSSGALNVFHLVILVITFVHGCTLWQSKKKEI
ncbi:unnamed protein product [Enterobius vermicularis]|uniref:dolichyl-P-Man:Man5GlcNAc2-PP-dolichol alpha-1,3-mannosyltransferase n=1 Tax=Enterobius vermicularis TaxID=51028 RepID=A0A0N4UY00_ENTVE|nr:unnamed protein product [Enterobius vermicularis]